MTSTGVTVITTWPGGMDRTAQGTVSFLPPVFIGQRMESRRKSTIWSLTLCECRRTMMSNLSMRKGLGFMMVVVVVIVVMVGVGAGEGGDVRYRAMQYNFLVPMGEFIR